MLNTSQCCQFLTAVIIFTLKCKLGLQTVESNLYKIRNWCLLTSQIFWLSFGSHIYIFWLALLPSALFQCFTLVLFYIYLRLVLLLYNFRNLLEILQCRKCRFFGRYKAQWTLNIMAYPCGKCGEECSGVKEVACDCCQQWFHQNCEQISNTDFQYLKKCPLSYTCSICCAHPDGSFNFDLALQRLGNVSLDKIKTAVLVMLHVWYTKIQNF